MEAMVVDVKTFKESFELNEEKMRRERMLDAVRKKFLMVAKDKEVKLSDVAVDKLVDIIDQPEIRSIGVVLTKKVFGDGTEDFEDDGLIVRYRIEKSCVSWGYDYVIYLQFIRKDKLIEEQRERFHNYMENRHLPLSDIIVEKVNLFEEVDFHIFNRAAPFVIAIKDIFTDGEFIGQDVKCGDKIQFVPNRPIGFVKDNEVYLSVPDWRYERTDWKFVHYN